MTEFLAGHSMTLRLLSAACISLHRYSNNILEVLFIIDMGWNYQYYQLQSDNKWLIQGLIDNDESTERDDKINNKSYL